MTIITPNMNLPVPSVGNEQGPDYAFDINNCLTLVDQHDHTPGHGVQIVPAGLNINSALTFNNNFATNLAGLTLTAQSSTPANNTIYESGVDLFYVDAIGNNIQITANGAVAGTPGSIANLVPPASASYVSGSSTFVWQSNTSIAANMDFGSATFRNLSPNSTFGVTVNPPAALGSNYSLTLPAIPGATSFLTLDTSGNIANGPALSGGITGSNIAAATITGSNIATATVTGSNIATATVTGSNIAAATITDSNIANNTIDPGKFSTNYTTNTFTGNTAGQTFQTSAITTHGRPVMIALVSGFYNTGSAATVILKRNNGVSDTTICTLLDATGSQNSAIHWVFNQTEWTSGGASSNLGGGKIETYDFPGAGTYTYKITTSGGGFTSVNVLVYEM